MSRIHRFALIGLLCWACLGWSAYAAPEDKPTNLLRLPSVVLEETTAPQAEAAGLKALTDDNPTTTAVASATPDAPLDIVFGFGGKTVAPEKLVVHLPRQIPAEASPAARVEILASTLSAHAGFQSLRADPLKPTADPQTFTFPPTAARWIMLRFTPGPKAKQVAVAEVAVLGHEGSPVTRYAFTESPSKAIDVLGRLKKLSSLNIAISKDEAALFDDVKDGRFRKWSFAEAALLESGVLDAPKRKDYLAQIDQLEKDARKAIGDAKSPFDKGEKLLKWLHKGPMAKGYESRQTDLPVILDKKTYNCVSSAVLFAVLARRLDLDVRAIEVPEHAFAIVYDGTRHADVETTTESGFNPSRDPEAQKEFEKKTGFRYIADSHRDQRREIPEAGLVAIIPYNHGVQLGEQKRYHEALLCYFRAMSLDPEFDSAVKNALAVLANWSVELSRDKKFEEALEVLGTGLALAPKDAALVNNHKVVWGEYAEDVMKGGKEDEALAILRKAADAIPADAGHFASRQAWLFIHPAEESLKAGQWEKALTIVEPGLGKLDAEPKKQLEEWRAGLYLRWGNDLMRKGKFQDALAALDKGRGALPNDKRILNNIIYTAQEWTWNTYKQGGPDKAKSLLESLSKDYSRLAEFRDLPKNHTRRVVHDLVDSGKYADALSVVDSHKDLLADAAETTKLSLSVFDSWAGKLSQMKKWEEAVDVYAKALERTTDDKHIKNNLIYTIQEWAKDRYAADGPDKAHDVLLAQIKRFPKMQEVQDVAKNHLARVAQDLVAKEKYDDALKVVDRQSDLLAKKEDAVSLCYRVYDAQAGKCTNKKDWQGAVEVYVKALEKHPKDKHLTNNAVAIWDQWAKTFFPGKAWADAIKVYENALKQFPDESVFKTNLKYCQEQAKK